MSKQNKAPDFLSLGKQLVEDLQQDAEIMGMDFIRSNFEKEGFMDGSFVGWQGRKTPKNYKLLRVTNTLFNSISSAPYGKTGVVFSADAPYAQIHNEGGVVKIQRTEAMRRYFWAMYKATKEPRWKYMAISKKPNMVFRMPKRQFMGESKTFNNRFDRHIIREILTRFKTIKQK